MLYKYLNLLIYLIIIIFISFSKIHYRRITSFDKILFLLSIIIISYYDKTISILFFILYILYLTNVEDRLLDDHLIESFSVKKEGFHDLNNVLNFLKTPKSKKILETMFTKK